MAAAIRWCLRDGGELRLEGIPPNVADVLLALRGEGVTEDDLLTAAANRGGTAALPFAYLALHQLLRRGVLDYRASGERGPLATASAVPEFAPVTAETYVLSRFAHLRRAGTRLLIESAECAVRVSVDDARVLTLLPELAVPAPLTADPVSMQLTLEEVVAVKSLLVRCGILVGAGIEEEGPLAYWSFPDLLFHARSRYGTHGRGYGATFPFRGRTEPLPANKPAMPGEWFDLFVPDLEAPGPPFGAVLERRRTTRRFAADPIHRRQLGEFLYRAARQRSAFEEDGIELTRRPYPGGGAIYELEIYVSVASCVDLPCGLFHYDARGHRLVKLPAPPELVDALLRRAAASSGSNPQVLLTMAARFGRMFWKYESIGYATILKDVGALYQTMYLVAEAMGLGACALGGGDSDLLARAAGLDPRVESAVGELLVGTR